MAQGLLDRLPNLDVTTRLSTGVGDGLTSVLGRLGSLGPENPGSPVAPVASALHGLRGALTIDTSGLTERFPQALDVARNALPAGALDYVRSLEGTLGGARQFLADGPIAKLAAPGQSLQDVALAVVGDILREFDSRRAELATRLIDASALKSVADAFAAIDRLRTNYATHRDELLPFLSGQIVGVGHDLLAGAIAHVGEALSIGSGFDTAALDAALGAQLRSVGNAFGSLQATLDAFDPADSAAYAALDAALDAAATAAGALIAALERFYQGVRQAVDAHPWDAVFPKLQALLEAVTIGDTFSTLDIVEPLEGMLSELLVRFQTVYGPDDLAGRIDALNAAIRQAVAGSPLGLIRQVILDFLAKVRGVLEAVPVKEVRSAVESMLGRVRQEVEGLHLDQVGDRIEAGLNAAEAFVAEHFNDALKSAVAGAAGALSQELGTLPVSDLGASLTEVAGRLKALVDELEGSIQSASTDLEAFVAQLDGIDFKPAGDEVVHDIDDLKARLQAINPNALSDVERLALQAALAVVQGVDLKGKISVDLKAGVHAGMSPVRALLDELAAVLETLRQRLDAFQPAAVLGALPGLVDEAGRLAEGLNARALLKPLYDQVDALTHDLETVAPGRLLDPLRAPFQEVSSAIGELDPARWTAPLNSVYGEIDRLIGFVDVTPLLDELDRRQRALLSGARSALLDAVDAVHLPEPFASFLGAMRPFVEQIGDVIFASPDSELKRLSLEVRTNMSLSVLFEPLDQVFQKLLDMIRAVPADDLTAAFEAVRVGLSVGLDVLDPGRIVGGFRAAYGSLAGLAPAALAGPALTLPALKLSFQARAAAAPPERQGNVDATLARFDAAVAVTARVPALSAAHESLRNAFRLRIVALSATGAEAAYGTVSQQMRRLLPDFLRATQPLTHSAVLAGLDGMRPSHQAARLEALVQRFLQELAPMEAAIEPGLNQFFQTIRDVVNLVNPLAVKDALAATYDTLRATVHVLDPTALADAIRANVFDPVVTALSGIDPAQLAARLDAAYRRVVDAVSANVKAVLDEIASALDGSLKAVRDTLRALADQLRALLEAATGSVRQVLDRVEHLVFVEILARLRRSIDGAELSFGRELDRVVAAFDDMLGAMPVGGGASASATVSVGP